MYGHMNNFFGTHSFSHLLFEIDYNSPILFYIVQFHLKWFLNSNIELFLRIKSFKKKLNKP